MLRNVAPTFFFRWFIVTCRLVIWPYNFVVYSLWKKIGSKLPNLRWSPCNPIICPFVRFSIGYLDHGIGLVGHHIQGHIPFLSPKKYKHCHKGCHLRFPFQTLLLLLFHSHHQTFSLKFANHLCITFHEHCTMQCSLWIYDYVYICV